MTPLNSEIQAHWGHVVADFLMDFTTARMGTKARVCARAEGESPATPGVARRSFDLFAFLLVRERNARQLDHSYDRAGTDLVPATA